MHKGTMMGLCLMAALGAVLLEVHASPDAEAISIFGMSGFDGRLWEERCRKQGIPEEKTNEIINRTTDIYSNLKNDVNELLSNLNKGHYGEGALNTIVDESCKTVFKVPNYFKELINTVQVCRTAEWKQQAETIYRILESVVRFQCSYSPVEIFLIAVRFDKCPHFTGEKIKNCFDISFPNYMNVNFEFSENCVLGLFSPTLCVNLQQFESCVLHLMESCSHTEPVNNAQSIFNIVKNETNCQATRPLATNVIDP
ncbi:hypothetical protein KR074_010999 [Drosophila pseudoananassae]|nr:hypothetical protein KR074_010999 [Drosophila pseudoananassae]